MEGTVDISEFFRKLKSDPFKDLKLSNVPGIKLSSLSESDDTFPSLQALSDLYYFFSGFMDYLWSCNSTIGYRAPLHILSKIYNTLIESHVFSIWMVVSLVNLLGMIYDVLMIIEYQRYSALIARIGFCNDWNLWLYQPHNKFSLDTWIHLVQKILGVTEIFDLWDSCMIKSLKLPKSGNQLRFLIHRVPSGRTSNALSIPRKFSASMFFSLIASVWASRIFDGNFRLRVMTNALTRSGLIRSFRLKASATTFAFPGW
ncbi:hypothetical protein Tco_0736090 [Tanacetum coccineum]